MQSSNDATVYMREATEADYRRVFDIWMQPHIIRWMSFYPSDNYADFRKEIFPQLVNEYNRLYVLVKENKDKTETVIGARRLGFNPEGPSHHVVGSYSLGIDEKFLEGGYAKKSVGLYLEMIKKDFPHIVRIELTQSGGNTKAANLVDGFKLKNSDESVRFVTEGFFPDWLLHCDRINYGLYVPETLKHMLLKNIPHQAPNALAFAPVVPSPTLKLNTDMRIEEVGNVFKAYSGDHYLGEFGFSLYPRVVSHIGALTVKVAPGASIDAMAAALREVCMRVKDRCKKIEIFSHEPDALLVCQQAGFLYRGEKIAALFINDQYLNEAGCDVSFFGFDQAEKIVAYCGKDGLREPLQAIKDAIHDEKTSGRIDPFFATYAENLAFQMVRDTIGPDDVRCVAPGQKPWSDFVGELPVNLQSSFQALTDVLEFGARFRAKM